MDANLEVETVRANADGVGFLGPSGLVGWHRENESRRRAHPHQGSKRKEGKRRAQNKTATPGRLFSWGFCTKLAESVAATS